MSKTALIVGASRGLGFAMVEEFLAQGWSVVATQRAGGAMKPRDRLEIETVDINDAHQVGSMRHRLAARSFDVVLVNAGVKNDDRETIADVSTDEFVRVMVTNALSPMRFVEVFQSLVDPHGTIAVMSSGQGSVTNNETGGYEVYRASKAALNTLMRSFAARHKADERTLLLLAPGWVRTEMGGPGARLSIEESIPNLIKTVLAQHGRTGLQYLDYLGRVVPW